MYFCLNFLKKFLKILLYYRPVNEWCAMACARASKCHLLFRCGTIARGKVFMRKELHAHNLRCVVSNSV